MLIDGAPGVGKTTLSRKVSCMWAKGELLKEYWLVLLLHLRESTISKAKTIDDFFYHEDSDLQCDVIKFVKDRSGDGVLIIFDGFDELSLYERSEESLFLHITKGKILPKCAVVVTSRPYASRPLLDLLAIHRHIKILGFKNEQVKCCIEQKVKDEVKAKALCSELKDRLDVASICQIPLNCSIVRYVYEQENYSLPCTLTKLFILHSLKRFIRRTQNSRAADRLFCLTKLPDPSREHLKFLCYLAYKGLKEDKQVFTRDDVEEVFPANYQELDLPVLDLMTVAKSYSSRGAHDTYNFLHLTIQEFLGAYWVAHHLTDTEKLHFFREHLMDNRFRMVLLFLSGLTELRFPDAHSVFSKDLWIMDNIRICHLLYESGNSSILKYLSENCVISKSIELYGSRFDALVVSHFIAYSGNQWDRLEIRPEDVKSVHRKFSNPESVNTSIKETVIKFCPIPDYSKSGKSGNNKLSQDLMILKFLDELTQIMRITVSIEIRETFFHPYRTIIDGPHTSYIVFVGPYFVQTLIETLYTVFVGPHSVHGKCYTVMLEFFESVPSRIDNQSANYCNSKTKLCETLAECLSHNGFITHVTLTSVTVSNVSYIFTCLSREDSKSNLAYFHCQVCNSQIPLLAPPVPMDFLTSLLNLISTNKSLKELNLDVPKLDALVSSQIMALKTVLISSTTLQKLTICKGLYEFKRNLVTNEMELTNPPMIANLPLKNILSATPITDFSDGVSSSPPQAKRPRK